MTFAALGLTLAHRLIVAFVPLDVPPPSEQFGFLPIMGLALLAVVLLVGAVLYTRHRKGRR